MVHYMYITQLRQTSLFIKLIIPLPLFFSHLCLSHIHVPRMAEGRTTCGRSQRGFVLWEEVRLLEFSKRWKVMTSCGPFLISRSHTCCTCAARDCWWHFSLTSDSQSANSDFNYFFFFTVYNSLLMYYCYFESPHSEISAITLMRAPIAELLK